MMRNESISGFTLLLSVIISSVVLAIGLSIFTIVFRQLQLSTISRASNEAFFAADAGMECALRGDFQEGVFEDPPAASIDCYGQSHVITSVAGPIRSHEIEFQIPGTGTNGACVIVEILKDTLTGLTTITSSGRNTGGANCIPDVRTVERTLEASHF